MSTPAEPSDPSLAGPLPSSPLPTVARWLEDAVEAGATPVPDAMALATVAADGSPSVRFVLCRGFDRTAGAITFFTSYGSAKARALEASPVASAVFHWDRTQRQARLTGPVRIASATASDAYWKSRPRLSQIAARASLQSEPIESRQALLERMDRVAAEHGGLETGEPIPRPDTWGGYELLPRRVELWVGSDGRAHDRALWERDLAGLAWASDAAGWRAELERRGWTRGRLQP